MKCSGEQDGCDRCIANNLLCEYTRSSSRGSRRGKKSHRRSAEIKGSDESPVRTRAPSQSSSDTRSRHLSPIGVLKRSNASSPYPSTSSTSQHESPHMSQLDFSLLTPADAFDFGQFSNTTNHQGNYDTISSAELSNSAYVMTCASLQPMLSAYAPYPPFHQPFEDHSLSPQPDFALDYSDSWSSPPHQQDIDPALTMAPAPHHNTVTSDSGFGYTGVHPEYMLHTQADTYFHGSQYWADHGGR